MATLKIDDKEYNIEELSEQAKATITSIQFVKSEIQRIEAQLAVYKTAEAGYLQAIKKELG